MAWAESRDDRPFGGSVETVAAKLDTCLTVVVVVGAETAGVTGVEVVVVEVVGEGTTIPEEGKETTPKEEVSVGPLG